MSRFQNIHHQSLQSSSYVLPVILLVVVMMISLLIVKFGLEYILFVYNSPDKYKKKYNDDDDDKVEEQEEKRRRKKRVDVHSPHRRRKTQNYSDSED